MTDLMAGFSFILIGVFAGSFLMTVSAEGAESAAALESFRQKGVGSEHFSWVC